MTCKTCSDVGIVFEPVLVGDQYEVIPRRCPECKKKDDAVEDDGFITIHPDLGKCK